MPFRKRIPADVLFNKYVKMAQRYQSSLVSLVVFSERDSRSRSLYAVDRPSVVCRLSVTLVHPTQPVEIFGNVSMPFGTLAIR